MTSLAATRSRTTASPAPTASGGRGAWAYALRTASPPPGVDVRTLDGVTRWLVVTRAVVLSMTLFAGLVAGLLAVRAEGFSWALWSLALLGLVLAHVCSNLMDDLSETGAGLGTAARPRALHAPHPIRSGMFRRRSLGLAVIALVLAGVALLVVLTTQRGWPVVAFTVTGLVLSIACTAPPLRRRRGLSELGVLVTWGPLMIAGTYFSAVGELPWQVWVASLPCGLLCTGVLRGQHVDALPYDAPTGERTLPGVPDDAGARAATVLLLVAFYAGTGLAVALGALPWPVLLVALALPLLRAVASALRRPRPRPEGSAVEPLSSTAILSAHVRRAGGLLVLGLVLAAVFEVGLPLR